LSIKRLMKTIELTFGNSASRSLIKHMLKPCPHGYRTRLEHALAAIVGEADVPMGLCKIETLILKTLILLITKATHADFESFKEYAKDPAVRRGLVLILKGIARYGITVPQKLPAPFLIVWNFTNMCNLKCKHCYQRADKPLPDELSLEEKLNVVEQLDKADVAAIAFSGGEPLIHPHFLRIASEAASRGMYISVATNGVTITEDFAKKMKEAGVRYVEVSLDSVDPNKHDSFRGIPGAWERAVRGIKNSVNAGLTTGIATTLTKMNYNEIEDIVNLAEELGVKRVIFFNFIPVGRGTDILDWDLSPEEREEALKTMYKLATTRKVEVASTAPQFARVSLQLSCKKAVAPTHFAFSADPGLIALADFIGGCGAGRIYAAVQPNGDVTPCVFMPIKVGNLREESFEDVWEKASLFTMLRNRELLKEPCNKCPYKYVCGGCRARAYSYTGDPLGPDPGCIIAKDIYYDIVDKIKLEIRDKGLRVEEFTN